METDLKKKQHLKQINKQNIFDHKFNQQNRIRVDKATDHLINPIEFQMMEENEKMRDEIVK